MLSHSRPDSKKRLLIAGFGDLGQRLVSRISDHGQNAWQSHALRRSANPAAIENPALTAIQADLNRTESLAPIRGHWDAVVYTATPSERTPEAYRNAYVYGLENLLQTISTNRLIFVSSTAVFGQDQGEWVDEDSPSEPGRFNGQILLEAERLIEQAHGVVVRFSGIYGPGRTRLIERARKGGLECRRHPPIWTNRIHADDCAGVLAHLLELDAPEPLYLASDHEPAARWDVYKWLAQQLAAPAPVESNKDDSGQGKRVRNDRLISSGYQFRYLNFRDGYRELIGSA